MAEFASHYLQLWCTKVTWKWRSTLLTYSTFVSLIEWLDTAILGKENPMLMTDVFAASRRHKGRKRGEKKSHLLKVIIKHGRRTERERWGGGGSRHYGEGTKRQLLVHQPESTTSLRLHNSAVRIRDKEKHRFTVSVLAAARGCCVNVWQKEQAGVRFDTHSLTDSSKNNTSRLQVDPVPQKTEAESTQSVSGLVTFRKIWTHQSFTLVFRK